jgi:hypothetical protein
LDHADACRTACGSGRSGGGGGGVHGAIAGASLFARPGDHLRAASRGHDQRLDGDVADDLLARRALGVSLVAGGQDVPLGAPLRIGSGASGMDVWQVQAATSGSMLVGGAEHVLSQTASSGGGATELTRFTTALGYDKAQGTAPVLRGMHLWRVRYPVADINSGNCVFAEYHGFITVDYDPATVPNTAASSVVHGFGLAPQNGGTEQTFVYVGDTPFTGLEPTGGYPLPIGAWQPELDPTRKYCLGISAFGDGDIARLPLASQQVCADVVQLSATGAPPPPQIGGGAAGGGGGGCAIGGTGAPPMASVVGLAIAAALTMRRPRRRR